MPFDPGVDGPGFGEPFAAPIQYPDVPGISYPTGAEIQLTRRHPRTIYARSFILPPVVVIPYVPPSFPTGGWVHLVRARNRLFFGKSIIRPPVTVNPALAGFIPNRLAAHLTLWPRVLRRRSFNVVRPPVIVIPAPIPNYVTGLAAQVNHWQRARPAVGFGGVRPPTVVAPAAFVATIPLKVKLAPALPVRMRPIGSFTLPPVVTNPTPSTASFQTGTAITLVRQSPRYRIGLGYVRPPAVVNPFFSATIPLRVTLAPPVPRALRRTLHRLAPPTVLGTTTSTNYPTGMAILLARRRRAIQPTHSHIYAPTVIGPYVPPVTPAGFPQDMAPFIVSW